MLQMHANHREDDQGGAAPATSSRSPASRARPPATRCAIRTHPSSSSAWNSPSRSSRSRSSPRPRRDQEKMGQALARLATEDPSFRVAVDHESGQTIIKGMGELHLEIIVDRMKREFKVDANVGAPQVAYRETITRQADVTYTHKKQTGGSGQFAEVRLRLRAAAARRRLRVRERRGRRLGAARIYPRRREGRARLARYGRARRLSGDRFQGRRSPTASITKSIQARSPSRSRRARR